MRGLACVGVFAEEEAGCFGLTPLGEYLQTEMPGSLRALAICGEESYPVWGEILGTVKTGETGFDRVFGMGRFRYLAQIPEAAANFNEAMACLATQVANAVVTAYDFSRFDSIVDVGGGYGTLIAAILKVNPTMRGVLFDAVSVVEGAKKRIEAAGLSERCEVVAGDFFESVPRGGEAYVLSHTIHNWDDDRSVAILKNCGRAMAKHGKLLLVEMIMPPSEEQNTTSYQLVMTDLQMMLMTGGRERTEAEYEALLNMAGFRLARIIPTRSPDSVIEGVCQ
jgi:ubiquinone/menaquinone biosynthesis C-methylase UbiE